MALTITALTSSYDNVDRTSYSTASVSPTASRWLVLDQFARGPDPVPPTPTISGLSLAWTTELDVTNSSLIRQMRVYAWTGASPGSGAITMDYGATTALGAGWIVYEIAGANGSDPFVQSGSAGSGAAATSVSVTLSAFAQGTNRPIISCFHNAVEGSTPDTTPSAYTELADVNGGSPNAGFAVAWNSADTDTTPSYSWTTSSGLYLAIASEIAEGTATTTTLDPMGMMGFFGA